MVSNTLFRKSFWLALILGGLALACLSGFRGSGLGGRTIIDKYIERTRIRSQVEVIKMVTLDSRENVETRKVLRMIRSGDGGSWKSLLRFMGPPEVAGVALLSDQSDEGNTTQYVYMPALGQTKRIVESGKKGYFMGSDFAYEDLLRENPSDFKYERQFDATIDDTRTYHIIAKPASSEKRRSTSYASRELWVSHNDFHLLKIGFLDRSGQKIKTLSISDYRNEPGNQYPLFQPHRFEMDHHQKNTHSMLVVTKGRYDIPVPAKYFSKEAIGNWKADYDKEIEAILAESG